MAEGRGTCYQAALGTCSLKERRCGLAVGLGCAACVGGAFAEGERRLQWTIRSPTGGALMLKSERVEGC